MQHAQYDCNIKAIDTALGVTICLWYLQWSNHDIVAKIPYRKSLSIRLLHQLTQIWTTQKLDFDSYLVWDLYESFETGIANHFGTLHQGTLPYFTSTLFYKYCLYRILWICKESVTWPFGTCKQMSNKSIVCARLSWNLECKHLQWATMRKTYRYS